jgi:hypothetical protein
MVADAHLRQFDKVRRTVARASSPFRPGQDARAPRAMGELGGGPQAFLKLHLIPELPLENPLAAKLCGASFLV